MSTLGGQLDDFLVDAQDLGVSLYDDIRSGDVNDKQFWKSLALALAVSLGYYVVVKWVFGQFAMTFNIVLAIFVFQNIKNSPGFKKEKEAIDSLSSQNIQRRNESSRTRYVEKEEGTFEDEFDYSETAKPTRFRQRSRPYKPRDRSRFLKRNDDELIDESDTKND